MATGITCLYWARSGWDNGEWNRMCPGNFPAESCVLVIGHVLCFETHSSLMKKKERGRGISRLGMNPALEFCVIETSRGRIKGVVPIHAHTCQKHNIYLNVLVRRILTAWDEK